MFTLRLPTPPVLLGFAPGRSNKTKPGTGPCPVRWMHSPSIELQATRTPRLLFRFSGVFLFRFADRQFLDVLFQLPPRFTRFEFAGGGPAPPSAAGPTLRVAPTLRIAAPYGQQRAVAVGWDQRSERRPTGIRTDTRTSERRPISTFFRWVYL